jgi:uncharacterized protein YcnI
MALVAGALLALAAPLAASAHVHIDPNQVSAGSDALLQFAVPNESATAGTTKVTLTIPQDTPFADVSYVAVPGWTTELTKVQLAKPIKGDNGDITEAVTTVTWTANPGSEITDGQIGIFPLEVGNVPNTGSIVLTVDQAYSDGTVVSWSDTGATAEHPAPVLYVNDAPPTDEGTVVAPSVTASAVPISDVAPAPASSDLIARVLGIGGLVLGAVALVIALTRRSKSAE